MIVIFSGIIFAVANETKQRITNTVYEKLAFLATENADLILELMLGIVNKQDALLSAVSSLDQVPFEYRLNSIRELIGRIKDESDTSLSLFFISEDPALAETKITISATASGTKLEAGLYAFIKENDYKAVYESKELTVLDPYSKQIDGKEYKVVTILQSLVDSGGRVLGIVRSDIDIDLLHWSSVQRRRLY